MTPGYLRDLPRLAFRKIWSRDGKEQSISSLCAAACRAVDLRRPAFQCGGRFRQGKKPIGEAMGPCSVQGFGTAVTGITKSQAQASLPASASSASLRHFSGTHCPSRSSFPRQCSGGLGPCPLWLDTGRSCPRSERSLTGQRCSWADSGRHQSLLGQTATLPGEQSRGRARRDDGRFLFFSPTHPQSRLAPGH